MHARRSQDVAFITPNVDLPVWLRIGDDHVRGLLEVQVPPLGCDHSGRVHKPAVLLGELEPFLSVDVDNDEVGRTGIEADVRVGPQSRFGGSEKVNAGVGRIVEQPVLPVVSDLEDVLPPWENLDLDPRRQRQPFGVVELIGIGRIETVACTAGGEVEAGIGVPRSSL